MVYAIIDADPYVLPKVHSAISKHFPHGTCKAIEALDQLPNPNSPLLQLTPYENIDFTFLLQHPETSLANSYVIRKALIRKHYLHNTITSWWSKHPNDRDLKGHVPLTVAFEVDYSEFLDEALVECWELHESFAREEREWWILKPSMSDQGQGVRLFSSEDELRAIFEEWEEDESESGSESDGEAVENPPTSVEQTAKNAASITTQLRHFIAQKYVHQPLLLEPHGHRKFHIRSYVLAVGAVRTYVYREMLALFAPSPYKLPSTVSPSSTAIDPAYSIDSRIHLTNTCLQDDSREGSVLRFWDLRGAPSSIKKDWKEEAFDQICAATGTLFEAAAREQMIHFQTLNNAFEVYGVDWIVDAEGIPWLLEVNAFPDFKQSGEDLGHVIQGLWNGIVGIAVNGFFRGENPGAGLNEEEFAMRKVLDVDLGRR